MSETSRTGQSRTGEDHGTPGQGTPGQGKCKNCSRPFPPDPRAENKKFCCGGCRRAWHQEERRQAMELLRANRTQGER